MFIDSFFKLVQKHNLPPLSELFADFNPLIVSYRFDWKSYAVERSLGWEEAITELGYIKNAESFKLPAPTTLVNLPDSFVVFRDIDEDDARGLGTTRKFWVVAPAFDKHRNIGLPPIVGDRPVVRSWVIAHGESRLVAIMRADKKLVWAAPSNSVHLLHEFEGGGLALEVYETVPQASPIAFFVIYNVKSAFEHLMATTLPGRTLVEELPMESAVPSLRYPVIRLMEDREVERFLSIRSNPNARPARVFATR